MANGLMSFENNYAVFGGVGLQLVLIAILFAVLRMRRPVTPRVSLLVNATNDRVFNALDIQDGKVNDLGRSRVRYVLEDAARQLYKFTYSTTVVGGREREFDAWFRVAERIPGKLLRLERAGLEGKSHNNELLEITQEMVPEGSGTRLTTQYKWGPRPLLAQFLARTDLYGGCYRLKGFIETGRANERTYNLITAMIGIVTGALTLATFWAAFGPAIAVFALVTLFIHEFGHLLAYRLIGQPWGRMMFLPFIGAIAMPKLPFESQAEAIFAALMGPGFSILLCVACALYVYGGGSGAEYVVFFGWIAVAINLFNVMPIEPLDGGIALRPVFAAAIGEHAHWGLIGCGVAMVTVGFLFGQFIVLVFGAAAIVANLKKKPVNQALVPLTSLQTTIAVFGYVALTAAYITLWNYFSSTSVLAQFGT